MKNQIRTLLYFILLLPIPGIAQTNNCPRELPNPPIPDGSWTLQNRQQLGDTASFCYFYQCPHRTEIMSGAGCLLPFGSVGTVYVIGKKVFVNQYSDPEFVNVRLLLFDFGMKEGDYEDVLLQTENYLVWEWGVSLEKKTKTEGEEEFIFHLSGFTITDHSVRFWVSPSKGILKYEVFYFECIPSTKAHKKHMVYEWSG